MQCALWIAKLQPGQQGSSIEFTKLIECLHLKAVAATTAGAPESGAY
jgi:hypothetical protein